MVIESPGDYSIVAKGPQSRPALDSISGNSTRHSLLTPRLKRPREHYQVEGRQAKRVKLHLGPEPEPSATATPQRPSPPNPTGISQPQLDSIPSSSSFTSSSSTSSRHELVERWLQNIITPQFKRRRPGHSSVTMVGGIASPSSSIGKRQRADGTMMDIDAGDVDQTPRPRRKLPRLQSRDLPSSSQPGSIGGSSRSQSTQSTQSKRSASPVKRITDMRFLSSPVVMGLFDDPTIDIRDDLWEIHGQVSRFARGIGVISSEARADIEARNERSFRSIGSDAFGPTTLRSPSAAAVAHLVHHAQTCDKKGHSEASWNCMVQSPLLDMALCNCGYDVGFLNCSTSRIQPTNLIPTTYFGQAAESKMVDFAIYLEETPELLDGIKSIAARHSSITPSFNQTFDPPLCTTPIAVSIETKKPGIEWDTAVVQVSTWAAAQFTKLEELLEESGHTVDSARQCMPFLPLFIVQGHDWTFLVATREPDGQTRIWSKIIVGSTISPLGVYQIIATLQLFAKWSVEVLKPWFWKHVLGIGLRDGLEPVIHGPI